MRQETDTVQNKVINGRIPYGLETRCEGKCPDCGTRKGELHAEGCDIEECPRCHGQRISCNCPDFEMDPTPGLHDGATR
jgi:hypothetical protein